MAKKEKGKKRYYRRRAKRYIRRQTRQISILKSLGLVGSLFIPGEQNYTSTFDSWKAVLEGKWTADQAIADTMMAYVGYDPRGGGSWNMPRALVTIVGMSLASKVVTKFAGSKPFAGIPFVSRLKF